MAESKWSDIQAFQIQMLSRTLDSNRYPLTKLLIERNLTKQEYDELFNLLRDLNEQYEKEKEEGFLNFTPLLIHFAGMLCEKLEPNETIEALKKEGYFPSLMDEFIRILKKEQMKCEK
jgi:hypothetical protein